MAFWEKVISENNPKSVLIYPDFLKTLPKKELRYGFAEVVKHALVAKKKLWDKIIKTDFESLYNKGIDALLTPTTPSSAFPIGKKNEISPVEMYLNDIFTVPTNLAGLPAISIPAGLDKHGLPLGLQLIGRPWEESNILNIANVMEDDLKFDCNPKKWWV